MNLSMYSGFSDIVKKDGMKKAAETASSLGFNSVEFLDVQNGAPIIPNESAAREYRKILEANGLTTACFSFGISIIDPLDATASAEQAVNSLLHSAEMAALVGSPYFHHTLILTLKRDPDAYESNFALITERLLPHVRRVADRCAELGITALYEPQGFYVNGKDRFTEFYRAVKSYCGNVGVCGDVGNPNFCDWRGEDFISEMASEIRHIHLKNYKLYPANDTGSDVKYRSEKGIGIRPVLLDSGDIDLPYCLDALKKAGYTGALALESEYRNTDEINSDIQYLKALFNR